MSAGRIICGTKVEAGWTAAWRGAAAARGAAAWTNGATGAGSKFSFLVDFDSLAFCSSFSSDSSRARARDLANTPRKEQAS